MLSNVLAGVDHHNLEPEHQRICRSLLTMLLSVMIPFAGSLLSLPLSGARSLGTANLDVGQISASRTGLIARQGTGNVPAQCKSMCDPVNSEIAGGCTAQKCCTSTFETQYFNCAVCVGNAVGITDYTAPQAFLNAFRQQCASAGLQVPVLVFPGQGSSASGVSTTLSNSSRRSSSTGPAAPITISAPGIPTLPVPSPTAPISQQTITSLSSTAGTTGTTGASGNTNAVSRRYAVSRLLAVVTSSFVAAWHLG